MSKLKQQPKTSQDIKQFPVQRGDISVFGKIITIGHGTVAGTASVSSEKIRKAFEEAAREKIFDHLPEDSQLNHE